MNPNILLASAIRNSWSNLTDVDSNVTKILVSLSMEKEKWDQMIKTEKGRETSSLWSTGAAK